MHLLPYLWQRAKGFEWFRLKPLGKLYLFKYIKELITPKAIVVKFIAIH